MVNKGMFGDLFSPSFRTLRDEERDEENIHQFQAQGPVQANAHATYRAGTMVGKGLGGVVAAATGRDPRSPAERNMAAVEAAKAQVSQLGFNPEDPKSIDQFYKQVISILQQKGLAAEAMMVAKEWNEEKHKTRKEEIALKESERKGQRDERNYNLGVQRIASAAEIARARNATAKEIADAKLDAESLREGPFKTLDYGNYVELINRHGEVVRSGDKAMNPKDEAKDTGKKHDAEQAYGEYLAGLQRQYDAAVQLYNHPGVEGITGRLGRVVGTDGAVGQTATTLSSGNARGALALHEQVVGGTFLAGLAKLKAASKTGATGLGAVSEREGDKVQSDAAALNRAQDAVDYRKQLSIYVKEMEGFAGRMAEAAQGDNIAPRQLTVKPLTGPVKGGKQVAPSNPAPAAPAAPGAAPKVERWERVNGKLQKVN